LSVQAFCDADVQLHGGYGVVYSHDDRDVVFLVLQYLDLVVLRMELVLVVVVEQLVLEDLVVAGQKALVFLVVVELLVPKDHVGDVPMSQERHVVEVSELALLCLDEAGVLPDDVDVLELDVS